MLAMIGYVAAAASALAAAAFGLAVLLGGSAHLGKEAAIAADKALHARAPQATPGNEVGAAAKTTGVANDAKAAPPATAQKQKTRKPASSKRKKRNAQTRNAGR